MNQPKSETTRLAILAKAKTLFAEQGFDGTSVRDIVDAAGVNVSLVSYYFGGKEGLYDECLQTAGVERLNIAREVLIPPATKAALCLGVERFVERSLASLASDLDAQRLVAAELDRYRANFDPLLKDVFLKVHQTVAAFFAGAQRAGLIREDLNPMLLASMLRGLIINETRLERVKNQLFDASIKDAPHRAECVRHIAGVFLNGIL